MVALSVEAVEKDPCLPAGRQASTSVGMTKYCFTNLSLVGKPEVVYREPIYEKNFTGGLILVSSANSDAFIFHVGLPLRQYITEGTGVFWREALKKS